MGLSIVLAIILAIGAALGVGGNFGDTQGLNGSGTTQNSKGINPVQHSE